MSVAAGNVPGVCADAAEMRARAQWRVGGGNAASETRRHLASQHIQQITMRTSMRLTTVPLVQGVREVCFATSRTRRRDRPREPQGLMQIYFVCRQQLRVTELQTLHPATTALAAGFGQQRTPDID